MTNCFARWRAEEEDKAITCFLALLRRNRSFDNKEAISEEHCFASLTIVTTERVYSFPPCMRSHDPARQRNVSTTTTTYVTSSKFNQQYDTG